MGEIPIHYKSNHATSNSHFFRLQHREPNPRANKPTRQGKRSSQDQNSKHDQQLQG